MKKMPYAITSKKDNEAIYPRTGVDIPYWSKYLTSNDPFIAAATVLFSGTRDATYGYRLGISGNYTEYENKGMHLIDSDRNDYGVIEDIYYNSETFEAYIDIAATETLPRS